MNEEMAASLNTALISCAWLGTVSNAPATSFLVVRRSGKVFSVLPTLRFRPDTPRPVTAANNDFTSIEARCKVPFTPLPVSTTSALPTIAPVPGRFYGFVPHGPGTILFFFGPILATLLYCLIKTLLS